MRVVEKCSCGATIEVVWTEPNSSYSSHYYQEQRESERAKAELATFRKLHKPCREAKPDA